MSRKNSEGPKLETLSGVDGAFLNLETEATPMHVGSLHLFETPPGYKGDFFAAVKRMLKQRMVPVLRRRLAVLPLNLANPAWVDRGIDIDQHVRRVRIPAPGDWAQLEAVVAGLHAELLDRSRPLWMMYVLEGLASGEQAYYVKIHHAMLDGQAGVALANILFDASPDAPPRVSPKTSAKTRISEVPGTLALAAAAVRHDAAQYLKLMRDLPGVVRTLAGLVRNSGAARASKTADAPSMQELRRSASFGPRTALNVAITPERGFATASLPRDELKQIAVACEATSNDVVLALCAGALRRYLKRSGPLPRKSMIASMPISLREQGNTDFRTQATLSLVSLATQIADPLKRLRAIRESSGATKAVAKRAKSVIPTDVPLIGVPWILGPLASLYGHSGIVNRLPILANVLISNVPGPALPLYVDGLRMSGYWPLSIVTHGVGLNITLMSYAGTLHVGFTAARCAVPDARLLADDFMAAYEELKLRALRPSRGRRLPGAAKKTAPPIVVQAAAPVEARAGKPAAAKKPARGIPIARAARARTRPTVAAK